MNRGTRKLLLLAAEYHGVLANFHQRHAKDYRFTFAAREAALDAGVSACPS